MAGLCPEVFVGSGGGVFWYKGHIDCNPNTPAYGDDTRAHTTAACPACPDPIVTGAFSRAAPKSGAPLHLSASEAARRPVYHKGVPNPNNPCNRPDEFYPGPETMVLAEYTAEYDGPDKQRHQVRLITLAVAKVPGEILGIGWELDPKSPLSSTPIAHFPREWIKSVHAVNGGHMINLEPIGWFLIRTAGRQSGGAKGSRQRARK
jgi:hypothetical protein